MGQEFGQLVGDLLERVFRRLPRGLYVAGVIAVLVLTALFLGWVISLAVR